MKHCTAGASPAPSFHLSCPLECCIHPANVERGLPGADFLEALFVDLIETNERVLTLLSKLNTWTSLALQERPGSLWRGTGETAAASGFGFNS